MRPARAGHTAHARNLVGRDLARVGTPGARRRRLAWTLLSGLLAAAMVLAVLRVDLLRVRYGLADAVKREKALLEQRRSIEAQLQALRDPSRLAQIAREDGLSRARRVAPLEQPRAVGP